MKDNTDVVGKFIAKGATIGKTNAAHISASTLDVSIIKDANNKTVVSADGLIISQSGVVLSLLQPPQLVTEEQNMLTNKYRWFKIKTATTRHHY